MTRPGRHLKDLGPIYILALLKSDHVYTRDQGSAELALNISQCPTADYQQYVTIVIVHLWDDEYNIGDPRHLLRYPGLGFRLCCPYPICRVRKHLPSSHNNKKTLFRTGHWRWALAAGAIITLPGLAIMIGSVREREKLDFPSLLLFVKRLGKKRFSK